MTEFSEKFSLSSTTPSLAEGKELASLKSADVEREEVPSEVRQGRSGVEEVLRLTLPRHHIWGMASPQAVLSTRNYEICKEVKVTKVVSGTPEDPHGQCEVTVTRRGETVQDTPLTVEIHKINPADRSSVHVTSTEVAPEAAESTSDTEENSEVEHHKSYGKVLEITRNTTYTKSEQPVSCGSIIVPDGSQVRLSIPLPSLTSLPSSGELARLSIPLPSLTSLPSSGELARLSIPLPSLTSLPSSGELARIRSVVDVNGHCDSDAIQQPIRHTVDDISIDSMRGSGTIVHIKEREDERREEGYGSRREDIGPPQDSASWNGTIPIRNGHNKLHNGFSKSSDNFINIEFSTKMPFTGEVFRCSNADLETVKNIRTHQQLRHQEGDGLREIKKLNGSSEKEERKKEEKRNSFPLLIGKEKKGKKTIEYNRRRGSSERKNEGPESVNLSVDIEFESKFPQAATEVTFHPRDGGIPPGGAPAILHIPGMLGNSEAEGAPKSLFTVNSSRENGEGADEEEDRYKDFRHKSFTGAAGDELEAVLRRSVDGIPPIEITDALIDSIFSSIEEEAGSTREEKAHTSSMSVDHTVHTMDGAFEVEMNFHRNQAIGPTEEPFVRDSTSTINSISSLPAPLKPRRSFKERISSSKTSELKAESSERLDLLRKALDPVKQTMISSTTSELAPAKPKRHHLSTDTLQGSQSPAKPPRKTLKILSSKSDIDIPHSSSIEMDGKGTSIDVVDDSQNRRTNSGSSEGRRTFKVVNVASTEHSYVPVECISVVANVATVGRDRRKPDKSRKEVISPPNVTMQSEIVHIGSVADEGKRGILIDNPEKSEPDDVTVEKRSIEMRKIEDPTSLYSILDLEKVFSGICIISGEKSTEKLCQCNACREARLSVEERERLWEERATEKLRTASRNTDIVSPTPSRRTVEDYDSNIDFEEVFNPKSPVDLKEKEPSITEPITVHTSTSRETPILSQSTPSAAQRTDITTEKVPASEISLDEVFKASTSTGVGEGIADGSKTPPKPPRRWKHLTKTEIINAEEIADQIMDDVFDQIDMETRSDDRKEETSEYYSTTSSHAAQQQKADGNEQTGSTITQEAMSRPSAASLSNTMDQTVEQKTPDDSLMTYSFIEDIVKNSTPVMRSEETPISPATPAPRSVQTQPAKPMPSLKEIMKEVNEEKGADHSGLMSFSFIEEMVKTSTSAAVRDSVEIDMDSVFKSSSETIDADARFNDSQVITESMIIDSSFTSETPATPSNESSKWAELRRSDDYGDSVTETQNSSHEEVPALRASANSPAEIDLDIVCRSSEWTDPIQKVGEIPTPQIRSISAQRTADENYEHSEWSDTNQKVSEIPTPHTSTDKIGQYDRQNGTEPIDFSLDIVFQGSEWSDANQKVSEIPRPSHRRTPSNAHLIDRTTTSSDKRHFEEHSTSDSAAPQKLSEPATQRISIDLDDIFNASTSIDVTSDSFLPIPIQKSKSAIEVPRKAPHTPDTEHDQARPSQRTDSPRLSPSHDHYRSRSAPPQEQGRRTISPLPPSDINLDEIFGGISLPGEESDIDEVIVTSSLEKRVVWRRPSVTTVSESAYIVPSEEYSLPENTARDLDDVAKRRPSMEVTRTKTFEITSTALPTISKEEKEAVELAYETSPPADADWLKSLINMEGRTSVSEDLGTPHSYSEVPPTPPPSKPSRTPSEMGSLPQSPLYTSSFHRDALMESVISYSSTISANSNNKTLDTSTDDVFEDERKVTTSASLRITSPPPTDDDIIKLVFSLPAPQMEKEVYSETGLRSSQSGEESTVVRSTHLSVLDEEPTGSSSRKSSRPASPTSSLGLSTIPSAFAVSRNVDYFINLTSKEGGEEETIQRRKLSDVIQQEKIEVVNEKHPRDEELLEVEVNREYFVIKGNYSLVIPRSEPLGILLSALQSSSSSGDCTVSDMASLDFSVAPKLRKLLYSCLKEKKRVIEYPTLSSRSQALVSNYDSAYTIYHQMFENKYHPTKNPTGNVNLCAVENNMCEDLIAKKAVECWSPPVQAGKTVGDDVDLETLMHYGPAGGFKEVKEALHRYFAKFMNAEKLALEEMTIAPGCNAAYDMISFTAFEPDDIVLTTAPVYARVFNNVAERAHCKLVTVPLKDPMHPKLDTEEYAKTIEQLSDQGESVTGLVIINPHNPLGVVFSPKEIIDVCNWANDNGIFVIIDEIFSGSVYGKNAEFESFLSYRHKLNNPNGTAWIWGPSKDFGVPGVKLSCVVCSDPAMVQALTRLEVVQPSSALAQQFIVKLLDDQRWLSTFHSRKIFRIRAHRSFVVENLRIMGIPFVDGTAGFYLYCNFGRQIPVPYANEDALVSALSSRGVFLSPGRHMGSPEDGWLRLMFACKKEELEEGIRRIHSLLGTRPSNTKIAYPEDTPPTKGEAE